MKPSARKGQTTIHILPLDGRGMLFLKRMASHSCTSKKKQTKKCSIPTINKNTYRKRPTGKTKHNNVKMHVGFHKYYLNKYHCLAVLRQQSNAGWFCFFFGISSGCFRLYKYLGRDKGSTKTSVHRFSGAKRCGSLALVRNFWEANLKTHRFERWIYPKDHSN